MEIFIDQTVNDMLEKAKIAKNNGYRPLTDFYENKNINIQDFEEVWPFLHWYRPKLTVS